MSLDKSVAKASWSHKFNQKYEKPYLITLMNLKILQKILLHFLIVCPFFLRGQLVCLRHLEVFLISLPPCKQSFDWIILEWFSIHTLYLTTLARKVSTAMIAVRDMRQVVTLSLPAVRWSLIHFHDYIITVTCMPAVGSATRMVSVRSCSYQQPFQLWVVLWQYDILLS